MGKKIALLYSTNLLKKNEPDIESFWLKREAEKRNLRLDIIDFQGMTFKLSRNGTKIICQNRSIKEWDFFIIRAIATANSTLDRQMINLLIYLEKNKKRVLNSDYFLNSYTDQKIQQYQYLSEKQINFPKTANYLSKELFFKEHKDFPVVFKAIRGSRCRGIYKINTINEAKKFLIKEKIEDYMVQEFIENRGFDVRAIILGNEVFGLFKRIAPKGNFKSTALGYRKEKMQLTKGLSKMALSAARACGVEFAGIDLIQDLEGKWYVLDVNENPRFKSFEEVFKLNLAKKIITYLTKNK